MHPNEEKNEFKPTFTMPSADQQAAVARGEEPHPAANPLSQDARNASASESIADDSRGEYGLSVEDAERFFTDAGYRVADRTISNYCSKNQFLCKKFPSNGVRRWFIKEESVRKHLEQLKADGPPIASDSMLQHASEPRVHEADVESSQEQSHATASAQHATAREEGKETEVEFLRGLIKKRDEELQQREETIQSLTGVIGKQTGLLEQSNRVIGYLSGPKDNGDTRPEERTSRTVQ